MPNNPLTPEETPQPKTEGENAVSVGLRAMASNNLMPPGGCLLSAAEEIDRLQSRLDKIAEGLEVLSADTALGFADQKIIKGLLTLAKGAKP